MKRGAATAKPRRRRPLRLRAILGGLALGALGLPFVLVFLVASIFAIRGEEEPVFRLQFVYRELAKAVKLDSAGKILPIAEYLPPAGLRIVAAARDGTVVYSSSPSFAAGDRIDFASATAVASAEFGEPGLFAESVAREGRALGTYYAWFSPDLPLDPASSSSLPYSLYPILFLVGLAVLVIFFSFGIAAQLARAVLRLERAAGRIAAGDLESPVLVSGSREIVDLAAAMDHMRASLREDKDRRARFLAAVSHDLRTPLTSIGGYLEAVEDGMASDPATLSRYVSIMRDKARLLEGRISSIIGFARMETGEWRMGFEIVELKPFLEAAARGYAEDAALLGRSFATDFSAIGELRVAVDRGLLARALENIVSNAFRHTPRGGIVRFSARPIAGATLDRAGAAVDAALDRSGLAFALDLDDGGPGVPAAERERIFEPFYRGSAARQGEGSGLGLYIARSVIRGHGWSLSAGEAPGGGGRFTILIPPVPLETSRPGAL